MGLSTGDSVLGPVVSIFVVVNYPPVLIRLSAKEMWSQLKALEPFPATILKFSQFLLFLCVRVTSHDRFTFFKSVILFVPFLISLPNQGSRDLLKEVNPESLIPHGRSFLTQWCNFRGVDRWGVSVWLIKSSWVSQVALAVKNLLANAGDLRGAGLLPGLRRSPGGGHGSPLQYSCLENLMDRGAWRATVHRVAKSWTWLKQ